MAEVYLIEVITNLVKSVIKMIFVNLHNFIKSFNYLRNALLTKILPPCEKGITTKRENAVKLMTIIQLATLL